MSIQDRARAFQARLAATAAAAPPAPAPTQSQSQSRQQMPAPIQQSRSPVIPGAFPPSQSSQPIPPRNPLAPDVNDSLRQIRSSNPSPAHTEPEGRSLSPDQVRTSLANDQITYLQKDLAAKEGEMTRLYGTLRAQEEEAMRGKAEIERLKKREAELVREVKSAERQSEAVGGGKSGGQPMTFVRFDDAAEAREVFMADEKLNEVELITLYESLLDANPGKAPTYHGALYKISLDRSSPSRLAVLENGIIAKELSEYLQSVKLPVQKSLQLAMEDTHESVEKEKTRASRLDAKLQLAKKDVESKITEMKKWRTKAESLEKELAAGPSKKASILKLELERAIEEKQKVSDELVALKKKSTAEAKEKAKLVERVEEAEKEVQESAGLKRKLADLEDELASARAANAGALTRVTAASKAPASFGGGPEKFVIERLATTVKALSADLTAKTAENAELMMRLAQVGGGN